MSDRTRITIDLQTPGNDAKALAKALRSIAAAVRLNACPDGYSEDGVSGIVRLRNEIVRSLGPRWDVV